ncbi:hypothetical protein CL618_00760 [archaeon]|nr:hypothetical protein [archaeon]|tara:strand:- start:865 stop:1293 length:429 start_codon:yes stop_codon:yes gene_type:complete
MVKKGYLLTLEAIIAVVILFLFIYSIMFVGGRINENEKVKERMDFVLKEISLNNVYRECVGNIDFDSLDSRNPSIKENLKNCPDDVSVVDFIDENLESYSYDICIEFCEINVDKNVYVSSVFISAVLTKEIGKEIYLYVWEE